MTEVFITAAGFVDEARFGDNRASRVMSCRDVRTLRWREVSEEPFDRFGRLDGLCRSAIVAVEMFGLQPPSKPRADWAICMGSAHGATEIDTAFLGSIDPRGGASPALFSYTPPCAVIGEIAIRHRITGPNACFMAGPESGALAFWESMNLILSGEARACVCLSCDSVSPPASNAPSAAAWAFLLEAEGRWAGEAEPLARAIVQAGPAEGDKGLELPRLFEFLASGGAATIAFRAPCALGASSSILVRRRGRDRGPAC